MLSNNGGNDVTNDQFQAIAQLLQLKAGTVWHEAARLVLVEGRNSADVAKELDLAPPAVNEVVMRVRRGMDVKDPVAAELSPLGIEWEGKQAVANARIEGFVPDAAFEDDFAQLLSGKLTQKEFVQRSHEAARRVPAGAPKDGGEPR